MEITQLITVPLTDDFGFYTDPETICGGKVVVGFGCGDDPDAAVAVFVGGQRTLLSCAEARELSKRIAQTLDDYDSLDEMTGPV